MKKHRAAAVISILLLLIGMLIFFFPQIYKCYVNLKMKDTMKSYLEYSASPVPTVPAYDEKNSAIKETEFILQKYPELWNDMVQYNLSIWKDKQSGLCDTWAYENPSFILTDYGLPDETFGIIKIPKMDLEMPLYLGANWQHMADGAAQLSQTSLPIGGMNTNCVIAGHRGWCGAPYFEEIMKLQKGDEVFIQNLWQKLKYKVTDIQIIEPNDIDAIHIQEGKDLVTLLTCHPYASGGKQRYLVICERAK